MKAILLCVALTLCGAEPALAWSGLPPDTQPGAERLVLMCAVDSRQYSKLCRFYYPIANETQRLMAGTELGWLDAHPFPIPGGAPGTEVKVLVRLLVKRAKGAGGFEVTAPPDVFRTAVGSEIADPVWAVSPHEKWADEFIPERAERLNQKGGASVRCVVTETGTLVNCWVEEETPPADFGFGDAIARLAQLVRMKPEDKDGAPVTGRPFVLTLKFDGASKTRESPLDGHWAP